MALPSTVEAHEHGLAGDGVTNDQPAFQRLVHAVGAACAADGLRAHLPSRAMCTDNAAMVAASAWWRLRSDGPSPLDTGAVPSLTLR